MILTTEERIYYTSRHFKRNEKEEGSAFFRRLHIPSSDRAGQNIQLNFLSWNEKKRGKMNNRRNFWIIFLSFFFSWKKKKKCSFLFSFGLIQSQNWRMGARERRKKMKWISISPYIYTKSKRSRCVCGSAGLSLSRISWMQSVSILHVPTDWSSRRRKIFLHPRSHHHIYSASISHNICVCVCVCFRSFLAQFFRLNQFLLSIRNVWQSAHSRLPIIPRQLFTILIRRASKKKKNEINTHICSYYFQNKLLQ